MDAREELAIAGEYPAYANPGGNSTIGLQWILSIYWTSNWIVGIQKDAVRALKKRVWVTTYTYLHISTISGFKWESARSQQRLTRPLQNPFRLIEEFVLDSLKEVYLGVCEHNTSIGHDGTDIPLFISFNLLFKSATLIFNSGTTFLLTSKPRFFTISWTFCCNFSISLSLFLNECSCSNFICVCVRPACQKNN